ELAELMGLPCLASDEFEADDLIGSIAAHAQDQGVPVVILSTDKDLSQLVHEACHIDPFHSPTKLDLMAFQQQYGFAPALLADFLALAGDPVDNIPGIQGIGKKTAQRLVAEWGALEAVFDTLDQGVTLKGVRGFESVKSKLVAGRETAFLFRELTRIYRNAPVPAKRSQWQIQKPDKQQLTTALKRWSMEKRLQTLLTMVD
ncbi:MAG TPA: 5'-3' exonuclease H3TH domain-containing protein, partial [Pseudomonadales bacterium]|nr:5'-3' exonuclease H3TH domain-containing protein [Pseudomonadales bacterium]